MALSFLFSHRVLRENFFVKTSDFAMSSKQAVDNIFNLSLGNDDCSLYTPAQVLDKIKRGFSPECEARFRNIVESENATLGIVGFDSDSKNTLLESSKARSFNGYVVTICHNDEKSEESLLNPKMIQVTPTEFNIAFEEANNIHDILLMDNGVEKKELIDCLLLMLFKRDAFERFRAIFNTNSCMPEPAQAQKDTEFTAESIA